MNKLFSFTIVLLAFVLLAGCANSKTSGSGAAVETYFQAIVAGDAERTAGASCSEWQETARGEVASFTGVKSRLEKLTCQATSTTGNEAIVECTGSIVAKYVDQEMRFDLSGRKYRVVRQDQKWLVCGYIQ